MYTSTITNIIEIFSQKKKKKRFVQTIVYTILFSLLRSFNISTYYYHLYNSNFFLKYIQFRSEHLHYKRTAFHPVQIFPSTVPLNCYPTIQSKKEKKKKRDRQKKKEGGGRKIQKTT